MDFLKLKLKLLLWKRYKNHGLDFKVLYHYELVKKFQVIIEWNRVKLYKYLRTFIDQTSELKKGHFSSSGTFENRPSKSRLCTHDLCSDFVLNTFVVLKWLITGFWICNNTKTTKSSALCDPVRSLLSGYQQNIPQTTLKLPFFFFLDWT